jgi:salicylate hydroxylase
MDTSPLVIAGGGIAGLSAALALGRRDTLIIEQSPRFEQVGAGIQIGPNAVRALQTLGAWDAVEPHTSKPKEIQFRDGISGKILKRMNLGSDFAAQFGADYHVAHRAGLHAGLLDVVRHLPNLKLEMGQHLSHVELGTNDVQFLLKGQSRQTSALICADGVQSHLRQLLFPGATAKSANTTFHRALLNLENCNGVAIDCVTVWMMPKGHVVHYGVGQPQHLNIVAITPEDVSPANFFTNATSELVDLLEKATTAFTTWPARYVFPMPTWTTGSVLLLGDAAHGTLPFMAQGAAMALEDAACLKQVLLRTHTLRHAFAETTKRRLARTRKVHVETVKTGRVYHAAGLSRHLRNIGFAGVPDLLFLRRLEWLYKH